MRGCLSGLAAVLITFVAGMFESNPTAKSLTWAAGLLVAVVVLGSRSPKTEETGKGPFLTVGKDSASVVTALLARVG